MSDDEKAEYFRDGWAGALRHLLEMSKVRGPEAAMEWARDQVKAFGQPQDPKGWPKMNAQLMPLGHVQDDFVVVDNGNGHEWAEVGK